DALPIYLEEGVVPRRVADVLQVVVLATGAHTLLAACRAGVGPLFQPQETVLELVHAGIGKQQRRIVIRHQRTGGYSGMALFFKEAKESFTDLSAFHRSLYHRSGRRARAGQDSTLYRHRKIACIMRPVRFCLSG